MTRSRWPLYSVIVVGIIVLTGVVLWRAAVPAELREPGPFDVRTLGLGSRATLVATMSTECESCMASADGTRTGRWAGVLTPEQQGEVLEALRAS